MDTYFLFTPTAWGESLQRSKLGRLYPWKQENIESECQDEKSDKEYYDYREYKEYKEAPRRSLFKISDMPDYLRFNPWILTGYRAPSLSTKQSLSSLTYLHNETVNILTHALPIVAVLANFRQLFGTLPSCWFTWFHAVSCLTPWCGSFVYHVLMNHRSGQRFYTQLLRLDMSGK